MTLAASSTGGYSCQVILALGLFAGCGANPDSTSSTPPSAETGSLVSRSGSLRQLVDQYQIQLTGLAVEQLPDRQLRTPAATLSVAAQLAELLQDQPYELRHELSAAEGVGQSRVTQLHIGTAATHDLSRRSANQEIHSNSHDKWVVDLAEASEFDRIDLLDAVALDSDGLEQLGAALSADLDTDTRLAVLARLDLGEEIGAKQLLLETLADDSDQLVLEALQSVDRWRDRSTVGYVEPLLSHANPEIAESAQMIVESMRLTSAGAQYDASANEAQNYIDPVQARKNAQILKDRAKHALTQFESGSERR